MPSPEVPCLFPGGTVACLASGPSLTAEDVAYLRGRVNGVVAVNDTHRLAPWADVLYSSDQAWWNYYQGVPSFQGRKYGIKPLQPKVEWGVTVLGNTGDKGIETNLSALRTGKNSGYAAVNLAVHLGARRILLLGYDMGGTHFFGDHPRAIRQSSHFDVFLALFEFAREPLAQLGVTVINCSRRSALEVFPRMSLQEALL